MRYFKRWQLAVVCLVALGLLPFIPARRGQTQATSYTVTDLGTLGGTQSKAYGINNCGVVSGESTISSAPSSPNHPFIWKDGQLTDIGTLSSANGASGSAFAINASASTAGISLNSQNDLHAFFRSNTSGTMTDLGALGGGEFSVANDINDSNQVVGQSEIASLIDRGFIWTQATGMQQIQATAPFASNGSGVAFGINNAGQVVGAADTSGGSTHGFLLSGGTMTDLGVLPGGRISVAYEVNDNSEVVGFSQLALISVPPNHAFYWSQATGMFDMGTLDSTTHSIAYDINNSGQAVGWSEVAAGTNHAFIWTQATGMTDLNGLLAPGSNWTLQEARSINERGQIVGFGINPDGATHAFLLTPDNVAPSPCDQHGSLQFSSATYSVSESGTKATINATRTGGMAGAVSVDYATSDGTATTADNDYTSASGTLNFADGETSKTFDVNVTNDSTFESDENVNLTLSNPTGSATLGVPATAVLTITNDDAAPTLSIDDVTQTEGNAGTTTFTFTVTKTGMTELSASASFATADGTATTADSDYASNSASVSFAANETTKQINVTVNGDTKVESDETFFVNLSNPSNATISDSQGQGAITNDDSPGTLQFSSATYIVGEGDGTATITVTRTGGIGGAVSASVSTSNGTATAGQDYTAITNQVVSFADGDNTPKTFTVSVANDALDEANETVNLTLSNATGGAGIGAQNTATLTINDDDPIPSLSINDVSVAEGNSGTVNAVFNIILSAASGKTVTVNFTTADNTATAGSDYTAVTNQTVTFNPGDTSKSVTVTVSGDTTFESNETFFANLSGETNATVSDAQGQGTITNDDAAPSFSINDVTLAEGNTGTTSFTFTVAKTGSTALASSVNFATANDTATAGQDYTAITSGTLNFAASDTTKTITVTVNGDTTPEGNETFFVNLSGATNATISDNQGQGTISNDDATLSISDVTVTEGNSGTVNAVFNVSIPFATVNTVTVNFATADGTATTAGNDYNSTSGQLTFNPGDTSKSVTVQVKGDTTDEFDETFFVNLSNPSNATLNDGQGVGTITDDDGLPSLSISDVIVTEGDSGTTDAVFTVTLDAASGKTVTINFQTFDAPPTGTRATPGIDYKSTSGTLTFVPGDMSESITVQVLGDTSNEPNEFFLVDLLAPPTNATLGKLFGTGTIINDDTPRLQFSQATYAADESLNVKVITVTRAGDPNIPVTVDYITSDGTASERNDYTFAFGTLRFAAGETSKDFDVLLTNDAFQEPDETINLTLSNVTGGAGLGAQSTATVTVAANDTPAPASNPIDDAQFFVRMNYHDFLGRRPDDPGLNFWTGGITACGSNVGCRDVKRIDTSAAFFLSIEFQNTGYLVERIYKVAYGDANGTTRITGTPVPILVPVIHRQEFLVDSAIIRDGVVVGVGNWEQVLENNKVAFAQTFVQRQRFTNAYATTLTPAAFVSKLNQNTGGALTQAEVDSLVAEFGGAGDTSDITKRASVLRKVAENAEVDRREKNRAFVLMQFFGYLQRDPNAAPDTDHTGWKFWLDKLDQFGGDFRKAEMVKAFITSIEYRQRFGQP
jgi:probable HAF family extracellular repeat protein